MPGQWLFLLLVSLDVIFVPPLAGFWGHWRDDPMGMPKGRYESGLKQAGPEQSLAMSVPPRGHDEGQDQEQRETPEGAGRWESQDAFEARNGERKGDGVSQEEASGPAAKELRAPLEALFSGYRLGGGAKPGKDLSKWRADYVMESLSRLRQKQRALGQNEQHSGQDTGVDNWDRKWTPRDVSHFLRNQNSLSSFL